MSVYMPKRIFDILFSLLLLIIVAPIIGILAIAIYLSDGHSPFYSQLRMGLRLKPFRLFKLRTMTANADKIGSFRTSDSDPRITRIGKILRKTSLDELPQVANVLKGDMSFVGNRPKVPSQEGDYKPEEWTKIHLTKPGITGLAQVSGRSSLTQQELSSKEIEYSQQQNFFWDLKILAQTAIYLVTGARNTN